MEHFQAAKDHMSPLAINGHAPLLVSLLRAFHVQDIRARAEALLFFDGKRDFLDEDEAMYASEDVDPVIQELVASVQQQLPSSPEAGRSSCLTA